MTVIMAFFYYLLYYRYVFTVCVFFSNYMYLLYFILDLLDLVKPEAVKNLTVDRIEYDPKRGHNFWKTKVTISLIIPKGAYFKRVYSYPPKGR